MERYPKLKVLAFDTNSILNSLQRNQLAKDEDQLVDVLSQISITPDEKSKKLKRLFRTPVHLKPLSNSGTKCSRTKRQHCNIRSFFGRIAQGKQHNDDYRTNETILACLRCFSTPPHFPWQIFSQEIVLPENIQQIFSVKPKKDFEFFENQRVLAVPPSYLQMGAKESFALEDTNWHREALFMSLGTIFNTIWKGNTSLSAPQVSLLANTLMAQSLGYFCGPDKKLFSPIPVEATLADVRPDAVTGFFAVKTLENGDIEVKSLLPDMEDLCTCLELLLGFGVCLGTNEVLLPTIVAEFKGSSNARDQAKLAYEMNCVRLIHQKIWVHPPEFTFGIYVDGYEWAFKVMNFDQNSKLNEVRTIWAGRLEDLHDIFHCSAIVYRLAAYLQGVFMKLTPDFNSLTKWIRQLAEENEISEEDMKKLEETLDDIGKRESTSSNDSDEKSIGESSDEAPPTQFSEQIQNFCNELRMKGYSDLAFLHQDETAVVFEARRGSNLFAFKISPWSRMQAEIRALKQFNKEHVGIVQMYAHGEIQEPGLEKLGYVALERLHALPKAFKSIEEGKVLSIQMLEVLAFIHQKNWIHRDVKHENIMITTNNLIRFIDFESAMKVSDTEFLEIYGTAAYKAPELFKTSYPHGFSAQQLIRAHQQGSDKADSFALGLVIASMMYGVELKWEGDIKVMLKWIRDGKISGVMTDLALDMIHKLVHPSPHARYSASQVLQHQFFLQSTSRPKTKLPATKLASPTKSLHPLIVESNKENQILNV